MKRRQPRPTLFPYPTLFRSDLDTAGVVRERDVAEEAAVRKRPVAEDLDRRVVAGERDRKSTRPNSSHANISSAAFCLKKRTVAHSKRPKPATTFVFASYAFS